ncbi:hypothetical protein [Gracilinema caldarium]|uniref:Uncharacterized protein n=1 Tax=Gracilinema caldarium (strain ATCC 51460 / DSM 7334 / H1) TaxID=744872 RepID=F8F0F8_GRAC1|nr:hypothetical protein [Gracilinema caldarium]AEJ19302.1 hypothetical protein Spica_1156 [Gracilinema caldarium DSM 7334]
MFVANHHIHRWLVLIPHRDCLKSILELQRRLWQQGICESRLLPPVAFLTSVEKPVGEETRKTIAQIIRQQSLLEGKQGYIDGMSPAIVTIPEVGKVLGLPLSLNLSQITTNAVLPSPILILALGAHQQTLTLAQKLYHESKPFRFRQGSVANLAFTLQKKNNYSSIVLHWELGKSIWMAHHG